MQAARDALEVLTDMWVVDDDDEGVPEDAFCGGIVRSDGTVVWLGTGETRQGPDLVLLPWGIASVARKQLTFDQGVLPVVAVGSPLGAVYCDVTVMAAIPGTDSLEGRTYGKVPVAENAYMTVAWAEIDFRDLPPQSNGYIEVEMRDAAGEPIGYPAREPFVIDPLASTRSSERVPQPV